MRTVGRIITAILLAVLIPACGPSVPPDDPAAAPSNLVVTAVGSGRIDLTWVDNATNEFDFNIERGDLLAGPFVQIGTAPKNASTYSDLGLQPGKTYYYRVAAWNSRGNSAYAGPMSATTQTIAWVAGPMTGGPAAPRGNHTAVFNPFTQEMLVFGGIDNNFVVLNELWALNLSQDPVAPTPSPWSAPANPGAPDRYGHSAIFDTVHRRMIVFGGFDSGYTPTNDVYILDLSSGPPYTWTQLISTGPTPTVTGLPPTARAHHSAVYDSANQRMIVYGGTDLSLDFPDVLALSLPANPPFTWSTLSTSGGPVGRWQHTAITDPLGSRMIVFGGVDDDSRVDGSLLNGETWSFTPGGWTGFLFAGTPSFRGGHSAVYDAANRRMLVFGGTTTFFPAPAVTNELWSLRLDTTPSWTLLTPTTPIGLSPRSGHSAVYDSTKNRMILYGGFDSNSNPFNDLWVIKL